MKYPSGVFYYFLTEDVNACFSVGDAQKELAPWSDKFQVSTKGYMSAIKV